MKRKKISETIEKIDVKFIDEATQFNGAATNTPKIVWKKWIAVAACFALMLSVCISFVKDRIISPDKNTVDSVMFIDYANAYLEIIESPEIAQRYGLEKDITDDLIGKHIVFLQKEMPNAERSNFVVSKTETDTELLEYAPAANKAVRIFRDGNIFYYALFANYHVKQSECLPVSAAFEVYGISKAADIASIARTKNDNTWKINGKAVTDKAVISEFFNELSALPAFSFDDYYNTVFADEIKKLEGTGKDIPNEAFTRLADDRNDLIIETKDGLRFDIEYYPSYGWIEIPATMSYYQMSAEITQWLVNNIK